MTSRRTFLSTALGTSAALIAGAATPSTAATHKRVWQNRARLGLPSGVMTGDVTERSAVLWARSSGEGRLMARLSSGGQTRLVRGPLANATSDFTARINLDLIAPGRRYDAELWFESGDGARGESRTAHFTTADTTGGATSFVWTGDTAGQGWGINPDLGGMTTYATMHATRPDFFLHSGDTVYADGPIQESVVEPDGQVWRNLLIPEVTKVAETLAEFRARHRYNLMDENIRALYADVPLIAQWDDHETTNNWYPGEILSDDRYSEKRVDVLAARGRQAWQEYQPINTANLRGRGHSGFAEARIYRKISRGRHLDVFCLDMRSFKGDNTDGLESRKTPILGARQAAWLLREVRRSTATWKVIANDLPLGLVVPDGVNQESIANGDPGAPRGREWELAQVLSGLKGIGGVVFVTADVHYCAAHHYHPSRAVFTDFDPFWEFVAGPVNAGGFGPNELDATFGPWAEFVKAADYPNQSPRAGNQFFGHAAIAEDGELTITLRDTAGAVLYTKSLTPQG